MISSSIQDQLNGLANILGYVSSLKTGLVDLTNSHSPPPLASQLNNQADPVTSEALKQDVTVLALSAYHTGASKGQGLHLTAYPSDLQKLMVEKLQASTLPLSFSGGVFSLVACNTEKELAKRLSDFSSLFPFPDLVAVSNRVGFLTTLETDANVLPEEKISGQVSTLPANGSTVLKEADSFLVAGTSQAQAYTEQSANPVTELEELLTEKEAYLNEQADPFASLTLPNVNHHSLAGTTKSQLVNSVKGLSLGFENSPYCVAVVMFAEGETLNYLKEVLEI